MNSEPTNPGCVARTAYAIVAIAAFLSVAAVVWWMRPYTEAPRLDAARATARAKALAEIRETEAKGLSGVAWIDEDKGLVRLPIDEAMKLVEREWRNPAAARSNLLARVQKAAFVPPPPPAQPQAPGQFE